MTVRLVAEQRRVLVVGLGTIAQTHLLVLGRRSDTAAVGGVDPVADVEGLPVFRTLDAAIAADLAPDLVVVATPTETHVSVVRRVVEQTDALVLCEKPLATTSVEIDSLAGVADRVRVAHHFAFSPEVEWALRRVRAAGWTHPKRVLSVFNDAYAGLGESRLASVVSAFVDSAPNQLSLLAPFVGSSAVVAHSEERHRAVTVLEHDGGRTVLTSNWLAADSSKQTTIEYRGDRQVRMDHTSLTASVVENGVVTDHLGYAGDAGRKEAHYRGLYDVLLSEHADPRLGVPLAADLARLLESSASAPPAGVRWSTIDDDPRPDRQPT